MGLAASARAEQTSPNVSAQSTLQLWGIIFASWKHAGASPEQWENGIWSSIAYGSEDRVTGEALVLLGNRSVLWVLSSWEGWWS